MSERPALRPHAASGVLGVLRAWLQTRSGEIGPSSTAVTGEIPGPGSRFCGSIRVLVVDDNPVNLMVISAQMESRGLSPLLAKDGSEAVTLACELHFDLILMDLQMPVLDGLGATAAIRRFETTSARPAVPVVAYSSSSPGAGILASHGLNGSLAKPCGDRELDDCLAQWCPTYRPPEAARAGHGNIAWQSARRSSGARSSASSP
jgi:CheY-like chemotaxis protein